MVKRMRIGVLALQGAFHEHQVMLERLGVEVRQVRLPAQLDGLDGLIIPGGESTTIGKLAVDFGLMEPLKAFAAEHALWGTCAGAIFMAREVGRPQPLLGLMDIVIERNAFGRQVASFETDLDIEGLGRTRGVFIRAPYVEECRGGARVLCRFRDIIVMVEQGGQFLATAFHPELTASRDIHRYFLDMI